MAKEFKIAKCEGLCKKCEEVIAEEQPVVALVRAEVEELIREDYHPQCWEELGDDRPSTENPDILGIWRTVVPKKEEKKKLLIDDNLLCTFFERLEDQDDPSRISFRYVLALILMRKKLLNYEGMDRVDDGSEIWKMRFKGSDKIHRVIDPKLDDDKIAEVSASLGDIMQGDFE